MEVLRNDFVRCSFYEAPPNKPDSFCHPMLVNILYAKPDVNISIVVILAARNAVATFSLSRTRLVRRAASVWRASTDNHADKSTKRFPVCRHSLLLECRFATPRTECLKPQAPHRGSPRGHLLAAVVHGTELQNSAAPAYCCQLAARYPPYARFTRTAAIRARCWTGSARCSACR